MTRATPAGRSRTPNEADDRAEIGGSILPGGLYLVATPIGNAGDITLRALDVLARAGALCAEDTRRTRKLMDIHGIPLRDRAMLSYNDHNAAARRPQVAGWLAEGRSVAYCTDAGTPLISDPGYRLAEMAIAAGHPVTAVPGASALLAALTVAGLPTDRFLFAGFLPAKQAARRAALEEVAGLRATLIFYESPRRLAAALADMAGVLGAGRQAAVARELTKRFEEVRRAPIGELAGTYAAEPAPKGEVVVLVGPPADDAAAEGPDLDAALARALGTLSVKDAAREVAARLGLPRREVYARALELTRR